MGQEDFLLQTLVDHINSGYDSQLGITLQMKGLLVTGTLIAGDKYFDQFANIFAGASKSEVAEHNRKTFAAYGDRYREGRDEEASPKESKTNYIHLQDCTFSTPSGFTNYSVLWRGKIAQVDGFFLGKLSVQKPVAPAIE